MESRGRTTPVYRYIIFDFTKTLFDINHAQEKAWEEVRRLYPQFETYPLELLIDAEATGREYLAERAHQPGQDTAASEALHHKWHKVCESLGMHFTLSATDCCRVESIHLRTFERNCRAVRNASLLICTLRALGRRVVLYGDEPGALSAASQLGLLREVDLYYEAHDFRNIVSTKVSFWGLIRNIMSDSQSRGLSLHSREVVFVGADQSPEMVQAQNWGIGRIFWEEDIQEIIKHFSQ